jgi:hypothetical protein
MSVLAIIISFLAAVALFEQHYRHGWRDALIRSAILHGLLIVIATEGLSLGQGITNIAIQRFWVVIALIHLGLFYSRFKQLEKTERKAPAFLNIFQQLTRIDQVMTIGTSLILLICGITAFLAAPNNYDSMSYHMPRVMHWIQNQSVAHYPTNNLRQIAFPPGSGYIIMHLQLLCGSDRLANLVQWSALVCSIFGVSLIAKLMIGPEVQILTGFLCATLPMAIMQSTTTQNDLVVGFWLVTIVYFIVRTNQYQIQDFLWMGLALSLAVVTKPTAIVFGFPLVVWLGIRCYGQKNLLLALAGLIGVGLGGTLLSIPNWLRNASTFGNPLGPELGVRNTALGLQTIVSNLLRTLALNLPVKPLWEGVENVHTLFGWNIADAANTFSSNPFLTGYTSRYLLPDEDFVGSPIHLIFFVAAILFVVFQYYKQRQTSKTAIQLLAVILTAMLLYCLLLKWQMWANRLILPLFLLGTPLTAMYLKTKLSNPMRSLVVGGLLLSGLFYSLTPIHHPMIALAAQPPQPSQSASIFTLDRESLYMSGYGKQLDKSYRGVAQAIANGGCPAIGIVMKEDSIEYPLWAFLNQQMAGKPFKIKNLNVKNESVKAPEELTGEVCATIAAP